jgi:hypothetical protein
MDHQKSTTSKRATPPTNPGINLFTEGWLTTSDKLGRVLAVDGSVADRISAGAFDAPASGNVFMSFKSASSALSELNVASMFLSS